MLKCTLKIQLTIAGPFITQSSAAGEYSLDAVMAKNSDDKHFIPGTHVNGKLRQSWEELGNLLDEEGKQSDQIPSAQQINTLLGKQLANGEVEAHSKTLYFSDFIENERCSSPDIRYRIQINEDTGTTKQNQLQQIESQYASGEPVKFSGEAIVLCKDEQVQQLESQILCGLQWVAQLGAARSVGFGRVKNVEITGRQHQALDIKNAITPSDSHFAIVIKPHAPFCIAQKPQDGNLFESQEIIPGNVLRGAIFNMLQQLDKDGNQFETLKTNFSKVKIQHAFPSADCFKRPVREPLSLVQADGLYDVALLDQACLINNEPPKFSVDWKNSGDIKKQFGWPNLQRELRVRTAIDSETLRSAIAQLFAYETIVPGSHCWHSSIDVSTVNTDVRTTVKQQLSALLNLGLAGIGKTKVPATVLLDVKHKITPTVGIKGFPEDDQTPQHLIITLQTPALLFACTQMNDDTSVKDIYKQSWKNLCKGLEMVNFFARQSLAGGEYQHRRFRPDKIYQPWALTNAGSVFVFEIGDYQKAKQAVETWQTHGLPLPSNVLAAYDLNNVDDETLWQFCPYIPQNGFGEIVVNLRTHWDKKPADTICTPIENLEPVT